MASKRLALISDNPLVFESNDDLKSYGYWDTSTTDINDLNIERKLYDISSNNIQVIVDERSADIDYITGSEHLFTSNTPNQKINNSTDGGKCLQIKFSKTGNKSVWFGKRYIVDYLNLDDSYRWVSPVGLSFSTKLHEDPVKKCNFYINTLKYVYKKRYSTKYHTTSLIENGEVTNSRNSKSTQTGMTYYVSDDNIINLRNNDYYCTGMLLEFNSENEGALDLYNFKPLLSNNKINKNNSMCILPAPITLSKRQSLTSSPIL
jgi:hypothetical protein